MNNFRVTISGIDESVSFVELRNLWEQYPFVEWGILYSAKSAGKKMRYPGFETVRLFSNMLQTCSSLHLCGDFAIAVSTYRDLDLFRGLTSVLPTQRVQVNGWMPGDLIPTTYGKKTILQVGECTTEVLEELEQFAEYQLRYEGKLPHVLLDPSGGRGQPTERWTSRETLQRLDQCTGLVGFAGGIGPHNVGDVLERLLSVMDDKPFWIDMETHVRKYKTHYGMDGVAREDLGFDLAAVEKVLETASRFRSRP